MMILCLNTSTVQFGISLLEEDGRLLSEVILGSGGKNYRGFLPALHNLMRESRVETGEIGSLAVALGPGSFTGLRVGLATAKGLCQGLDIPAVGVSSLEAMASQAPLSQYPVCPLISSRKGEVFAALFRWSGAGTMERIKEDACLKFREIPSYVEGEALFLGNDFALQAPPIQDLFSGDALLAPAPLWTLRASAVGLVAFPRIRAHSFDDLQDLIPAYMRPPDIRPNPYPLHRP
ncbi:MAG: tRNA (adenosine(37)-N6)-threonylcarbamoyltransferase complex dimerization subunit type 1 TsaB [Deltaproteobacteria bacterium]|nr:tRNA (adenosine(37)-N6)-threonylcarbamoyltransferase complex dimerization subunit type 1 TsaB [Deltaproteobacteria bacterium]